jgi:tagaturonate reductase
MQLSRAILNTIDPKNIQPPAEQLFDLPEKVLQFGTGVLLRGLPDYFIDKANKANVFKGRIVVVKSTANGRTDAFKDQNGLYTLVERGMVAGETIDHAVINASVSRVLSATEQWSEILACAANPEMQIIISNTTEVGIVLDEEDAEREIPKSFPGRLLFFLLKRFEHFNGSTDSGMVILPTELVVDNGTKLKNIVLHLAKLKNCSPAFTEWLTGANEFCNTLVDCIVPGKLPAAEIQEMEQKLGYTDELMIMSEPYRLWAIETNRERTHQVLSFSKADSSVILAPDINKFRELKLRLLNATHTFSCGLAYLCGFVTVKEAMKDKNFTLFVKRLMLEEIRPLVAQGDISSEEAEQFSLQVIDRFRNPNIDHLWLSITAQYTSKIAMRTVPLIQKYFAITGGVPDLMAMGYAAYILFMRTEKRADHQFYGSVNDCSYPVQDDKAGLMYHHWQTDPLPEMANKCLRDNEIFGTDLTGYPGFAETVQAYLQLLMEKDAVNALGSILAKKITA